MHHNNYVINLLWEDTHLTIQSTSKDYTHYGHVEKKKKYLTSFNLI